MGTEDKKNRLRAFWDFFVLFSGISTASNLSRTQGRPVADPRAVSCSEPEDSSQANQPAEPR